MEDPYKTLGVTKGASQAEIRGAYRRLAKKHHPDLNPGSTDAEDRFKMVSAANDLLSDPEKRTQFDRGEIDAMGQERATRSSYRDHAEGEAGGRYSYSDHGSGGLNTDDFADLFGSMFNGARSRRDDDRSRGVDEQYSLETDFLGAINGATRRLTLPDGRSLDAKIPPGTSEGQILRLRGQGGPGWNGGPSGDALIEIRIAPHPYFRREGQNIRMELPVTVSEAVLGGLVETPTPGGLVKVRIPPHSDSGSELRLRGRGVPKHGGVAAGDLYARLRVVIGVPDEALEDFLRAWKPDRPGDPRQGMGER